MAVIKESSHTYGETVARFRSEIERAGLTVFATIDQAAAAERVGLSLRPTTLLVFGNPKGGTGLMDAHPLVALDLPLKMLIWEENGRTSLAYVPMSEIAARYGIAADAPIVAAMDAKSDELVRATV